ncbi:MAG TPA: M36 family metallopeptidase [Actinomycetota bacterium]|nr:M36 family metallopeptidase [Actinomycetota bacterium]
MARELDVRNFSENRATKERRANLDSVASRVSDDLRGDHRIRIANMDATTGNPAAVVSEGAPAEEGDVIARALDYARSISPALGLAPETAEFSPDPEVQETSSGAKVVNLQQLHLGIPIFQSATSVRFGPEGKLLDAVGSTVTVGTTSGAEPSIRVEEAVLAAARHVAEPDPDEAGQVDQFGQPLEPLRVDLEGLEPKVQRTDKGPRRRTVLEPGPFAEPIVASLVWFPLNDELRLAWRVSTTFPNHFAAYKTLVDAESGRILYCRQTVQHVAATGNVYRVDGSTARQSTPFPRPIVDYALPFPTTTQQNWRWCNKCQGLFYGPNIASSDCPTGGTHVQTGSGNYRLVQNAALYPGQQNWRWCNKCQGLFYGPNIASSDCPAGGTHAQTASGNYVLVNQSPLAGGQHGWRWCNKCQGLFFGLNTGSACPDGGAHNASGSGDYSLLYVASGLPANFPNDWVSTNATVGNSTNAHVGNGGAVTGTTSGNTVNFNPASAMGSDQQILNTFYLCCYMHDFSYMLGFTEPDGNFQKDNFGRGGLQADSVDARSWPQAVPGTANMLTPVDGQSPVMNMGLYTPTNRHTAFDSSVVYHEFTHGITNRLVGGPANSNALDSIQSGGMGEGWSDYIACTINNSIVVGSWLLNNAGGIRLYPYNSSFPDDFGDLGTGRYTGVHAIGEIWCATLMEMGRRTNKYLALQLVIDALKLSPANPSFLNMRDAIVAALTNMATSGRLTGDQRNGAWQGVWWTFARFGMGPQAQSNGAQVTGIVADYTVGQDGWRWCNKCQGMFYGPNINASDCPAGGAHAATGSGNYDIVVNWPAAPGQSGWRWCNKCQGMFYGPNINASDCPAGGPHASVGSGDYKLVFNAAGSSGQYGWRWCYKCQGLFFGPNINTSDCPAGGAHGSSGSGNYSLMAR